MGNSQSKPTDVEVPRRPQNRLSKPRTITASSLSNAPSAASRRDSSFVVPLAVPDNQWSSGPPDNPVGESGARSRKRSLSTRQRLQDRLFRSKSSDGKSRVTSLATREEPTRDAAVDQWPHSRLPRGQNLGDEQLSELDRYPASHPTSRPTSRRSSTAFTSYSNHGSRLSLVIEANTPEPNMDEASQRLEQLPYRAYRSNSDVVPIRRRSLLMVPGVATRRDSNGELLYESFPVSRRLSNADTLGSRRSSWFDQLKPDMSPLAELPAIDPLSLPPVPFEDAPRTVTPSEQEFALGAYKLGTLRITNADSHDDRDEDSPKSLPIGSKQPRPQIGLAITESPVNSTHENHQDPDSLSPFSFDQSRSPSPQLQTTSKNTAVEEGLFDDDQEVAVGSSEHAFKILDGTANAHPSKPSFERCQTAPVRVSNSFGSLDVTIQRSKEMPYKPLTKNDSGYSSNVSLRSFKAQAEARTAAAKLNDSEASGSSNIEEVPLPLNSHPVTSTTLNAPPPLPQKSLEQKMAAATQPQSQTVETNKQRNFRPGLTINRKSLNASPKEIDQSNSSPSTLSPSSLIKRLTRSRTPSQPIVVTSDHKVSSHIPSVSASASAKLEQRQKECPTLSHTYKSTSRTNSRETMTTILSMPESVDTPPEPCSSLGGGNTVAPPRHEKNSNLHFDSTSPSMPEGRTRAKTLERPTSKEHQSEGEFVSHITSFGAVSESLGASPYDLAISAMTPRKRSQSFHDLTSSRLSNSNRSHSSNDLAAHNTSSINPKARKGMDANTASQLAREKSRDREVGRRASFEKARDDRSALPSSKMAMRASLPQTSSPMRSPHVNRRNISAPKPSRTPQPPPVTMSAYRRSLPSSQVSSKTPTDSGPSGLVSHQEPAAPGNHITYPKSGPWVPQRPQVMHRKSTNNLIHAAKNSHKTSTRRISFDARQLLDQSQKQSFPPRDNTISSASKSNITTDAAPTSPTPKVLDRYDGGLTYRYEAGYDLIGSAGMRTSWTPDDKRNSVGVDSIRHYGLDFGDIPVMVQ